MTFGKNQISLDGALTTKKGTVLLLRREHDESDFDHMHSRTETIGRASLIIPKRGLHINIKPCCASGDPCCAQKEIQSYSGHTYM